MRLLQLVLLHAPVDYTNLLSYSCCSPAAAPIKILFCVLLYKVSYFVARLASKVGQEIYRIQSLGHYETR